GMAGLDGAVRRGTPAALPGPRRLEAGRCAADRLDAARLAQPVRGQFQNVAMLSMTVQEGRMDGFLMRPMPVYRQVLLSRFQINSFGDLLAGAGIFVLALFRLDLHWTALKAA